ncbi:hypothetical protein N0B16_05520 [Chryseobacterium sp. GMJ5]|uniref:Lipoprotein n=1 Tax=Chryseobacterium gilvum TaxID=2976534 RepID=A0ABT2VVW1_9FLAO|nr:hypothetical protein [Chryseobacterium gilvum]MCU7613890.1 hypothetical protein [Chryseobacterium gilvum]
MTYSAFLMFILFLGSCSKTQEENCFIEKDNTIYKEEKPFTAQQILTNKPEYLEVISLKNFRPFKQDSTENENNFQDEKLAEIKWRREKEEYKNFREKFYNQFSCSNKQRIGNTEYCLGKNNLGFWLLKIDNHKADAYFLGLSFSHYYLNKIQTKPIINNGFLELEGSLVKIIQVGGLPGYEDYSAIEDGKLFKIKLDDLIKDSDNDGYNDIFENSFGLNTDNKDTDGDGTDDFNDMNPLFTSEKNKFSELYLQLLPTYATDSDFKKKHYYFEVFKSDCAYFHEINPNEYRVLFSQENQNKQTDYLKVTDVFRFGISKIKKNKNNPKQFFITEWGSSSVTDYSAEYKNDKWVLTMVGGSVI